MIKNKENLNLYLKRYLQKKIKYERKYKEQQEEDFELKRLTDFHF